ncbi:MAG TPA: gamma-butyrobetaine hydroxylase-like domain-containing protein [Cellvibrio sp.]|nr:gamma-butyrobetaine hydroxylase-like domain-containing protein [Cellvibrio sp.]
MNHSAPLSLINSKQNKQVTVQWSAEETETVSHQYLRGACPCAKCRAARIQGHISLVNADVELIAMNPMGYGLQMVFSDGHDRGVYPWSYLRDLIKTR